jgi:hypothetical protein
LEPRLLLSGSIHSPAWIKAVYECIDALDGSILGSDTEIIDRVQIEILERPTPATIGHDKETHGERLWLHDSHHDTVAAWHWQFGPSKMMLQAFELRPRSTVSITHKSD